MPKREEPQAHDAWASLRFAIVGPLLARPPRERGELLRSLEQLAQTSWRHPITGEPVQFAVSTIERWYYRARSAPRDPVGALRNRIRQDAGTHATLSPLLRSGRALPVQRPLVMERAAALRQPREARSLRARYLGRSRLTPRCAAT